MAQFKIENKKLSIEIFGVVYEISKPKFKDIIAMDEQMDGLKSKDKMLFIQDNLIKYGLPQSVIDELDGSSVVELLEIINGTKKN